MKKLRVTCVDHILRDMTRENSAEALSNSVRSLFYQTNVTVCIWVFCAAIIVLFIEELIPTRENARKLFSKFLQSIKAYLVSHKYKYGYCSFESLQN